MRENTLAPGNPGTGESGAAFTINNCNYKAGNMSSIETKETKCSYRAGIDIGPILSKYVLAWRKSQAFYGFLNLTNYRFNILNLKSNMQEYNADFPGDIQKSQVKFSEGHFIK